MVLEAILTSNAEVFYRHLYTFEIIKIIDNISIFEFLEIPPECRNDEDCGLERICLKQKCIGIYYKTNKMKIL